MPKKIYVLFENFIVVLYSKKNQALIEQFAHNKPFPQPPLTEGIAQSFMIFWPHLANYLYYI